MASCSIMRVLVANRYERTLVFRMPNLPFSRRCCAKWSRL